MYGKEEQKQQRVPQRIRFVYKRKVIKMNLIDNSKKVLELEQQNDMVKKILDNEIVMDVWSKDFIRRFCWSNNALEGNTLSFDETVQFIDYDEVRSGHKFSEYQEAKNVHQAIMKMLIPLHKVHIDEKWIQEINGIIVGKEGQYRREQVYIGSVAEAIYYPPNHEEVPKLMEQFVQEVDIKEYSIENLFSKIALQHIIFERIHPFQDGNGRTGRFIINQQLINHGFLPISIPPIEKYRQAFRRYDKNGDYSSMIYVLLKSELEAFERVFDLNEKYLFSRSEQNISKLMCPDFGQNDV